MGFVVDYNDAIMEWNGSSIPMKDDDFPCCKGLKSNKQEIKQMIAHSAERKVIQEATSRILKRLDSDYKKADREEVVAKATQLSASQQQKLLKLLRKYEDIFDGTLGKWNTGTQRQLEANQLTLLSSSTNQLRNI
jgi:predicted transposase YdaD